VINAAAPECSKAQASSRGVENVVTAATTAPILAGGEGGDNPLDPDLTAAGERSKFVRYAR
jgi:hypothetical protein